MQLRHAPLTPAEGERQIKELPGCFPLHGSGPSLAWPQTDLDLRLF